MMKDRLLKQMNRAADDTLDDCMYSFAFAMETMLIEAGAKEGDYTLMDLYTLAQPFALERFKEKPLSWDTPFK